MAEGKQAVRTEARVANGALVVSFSGGETPKVWRADLSPLSSSAFELKEGAGRTVLVLKSAQGAEDIQSFAEKKDALQALSAVTEALFSQERAPAGAAVYRAEKKSGFFGKLMKFLFYMFIVIVCMVALTMVRTNLNGTSEVKPGVPVPAEDMFGK